MRHLLFFLFLTATSNVTFAQRGEGTINEISTFSLGLAGTLEKYDGPTNPVDYRAGLFLGKPIRSGKLSFETGFYYARRSTEYFKINYYNTSSGVIVDTNSKDYTTGMMTLPLSLHFSAIRADRFRLYIGGGVDIYKPYSTRTYMIDGQPADATPDVSFSRQLLFGGHTFMGAGFLLKYNLEVSGRFIVRWINEKEGISEGTASLGALIGLHYHFNR